MTIQSDASKVGWGAAGPKGRTGGPWTREEKAWHINYLELLAAFFALKSLASQMRGATVLLQLDNVAAIAFINKMGGTHSRELSNLAVNIWKWCIQRNIFIHAEHLPGTENVQADWESRHLTDLSNWRLNQEIFMLLEEALGLFSIDLFTSRTNTQLPVYCSWRPDPGAIAVDAFSISWKDHYPYIFPPFTLIPRCLNKIKEDNVTVTIIAPLWPNQTWFPLLLECLVSVPLLLPPTEDILLNSKGKKHPLAMRGHLPLVAWPVSGDHSDQKDFLKELSGC